MTIKVDGTNGVLQAYDYQVLTTGFSYTFAAGTQTLVINPAGTLASGTVTMPASPADGMVITVVSTQQVTAVTVAANTGQTMVGGASQLIPNQPLSFVYRLSNTTWYPYAGGAGRASQIAVGTSVASTSGTSIDFTGIPSWTRRITVMFNGISLSGTSFYLVQLGSGSVTTTGYVSAGGLFTNANQTGVNTSTSGFIIRDSATAAAVLHGTMTITLFSGTTWTSSHSWGDSTQSTAGCGGGYVTLSGAVDRLRMTTVNGTDTYDAGNINIAYE